MRSISPVVAGVVAFIVFACAFGATWLMVMRDTGGAPPASSLRSESAAQAPVAAASNEAAAAEAAAESDAVFAAEQEAAIAAEQEAGRRELALERARETAVSATPESDQNSAVLPEDRAATAKGLAIGERIDSHRAARFQGNGTFRAVSSDGSTAGRSGRTVTYAIEIENGLNISDAVFAREVTGVLSDSRSWIGSGRVRVQQVANPSAAQYTIRLSSPQTTDRLCAQGGMTTEGIYSCREGRNVVLNYYRWMMGAYEYPNALSSYRIYMVNHEFGHAIGHGHRECGGAGSAAPVMLQQSISSRGCASQPWPLPSELAQQS